MWIVPEHKLAAGCSASEGTVRGL